MKNLLLIVIVLFCFACTTARKAEKFYAKNPELLAKICSDKFPIIPNYIPGKPILIRDTIPGDSIPCPEAPIHPETGKYIPVKVKCPDSYRDTIFTTDTIYLESTAKLKVLQSENGVINEARIKAHTENGILKRDLKIYRWVVGVLGIMVLCLGFVFFRKL